MTAVDAAIERLDFVLPDFTRLSWVSDRAREIWEPRLRRITKAWFEIEWLTVLTGLRRCGVTVATPDELVVRGAEWVKRGLSALPLEIESLADRSSVFRIVVGKSADLADFTAAWDEGDHHRIGRLLGHPPCCVDFCHVVTVRERLMDTTWLMARQTTASVEKTRIIEVIGPPETNILWRWMGARLVPHLPCRFDCRETIALGRQFAEVGRTAGYDREMSWLLEILSWPVEWSALHGIAEIKTPVLRVSTRTDATASKYVVRRPGNAYPIEGAHALPFPYRAKRRPVVLPLSCQ